MKKIYVFLLLTISFFGSAQNAAELDTPFTGPGAPPNYWYFTHPEQGVFYETPKAALQPDGQIIVATGKGLDRVDGNLKDTSFQTNFTNTGVISPRF